MPPLSIKKIEWQEVSSRVRLTNPTVATAIDALAQKSLPPLYLVHYPFGALLVQKGTLQIPHEGRLHPIDHPNIPQDLAADLSYSKLPMFMNMNKTAEVFLPFDTRTYPLHLFTPGKLLGIWPLFDGPSFSGLHSSMWSMAAGARTLFMLPKAMDYGSHSKMQRHLHLDEAYPPHNLFDQGPLFANIANSAKMQCNWQCETLLFSKGWAEKLLTPEWEHLHHVLLQQEWTDSIVLRNHLSIDMAWQVLAHAQAQTRLKPNSYVIDTVKHLTNIATNAVPGFAPLTAKDDAIAPITIIQQAYLEYYQLKQYIPTILAPAYLQERPSLYYSFLHPTLLSLSPNHNFRNTLEDERNIKLMLELFQGKLAQIPDCQYLLPKNLHFDFFHFEADEVHHIHPVIDLAKIDPLLSSFSDPEFTFAENGPFIRACVRIHRTSDSNS